MKERAWSTLLHSMGFQSMGQSIMLQYCTNRGGGWEQRSGVTGSVLLPPRATSWMHWTSRDWMPPPHVFEHGEKSEMFQRGGHGMSLHVRVIESGRVSMRHRAGFTCSSSEIRTHSVIDSCTPFFCFFLFCFGGYRTWTCQSFSFQISSIVISKSKINQSDQSRQNLLTGLGPWSSQHHWLKISSS